MKKLFFLLVCFVLGCGCKTVQRVECVSKKIHFITYHDVAKGTYRTLLVPYCDTLRLHPSDQVPDGAILLPDTISYPLNIDTSALSFVRLHNMERAYVAYAYVLFNYQWDNLKVSRPKLGRRQCVFCPKLNFLHDV